MDFWKVIYENVQKKFTTNTSIYVGDRNFEVLWVLFCTYCKGLLCLKKQSWHLYSSVYA